MDDDHRAGNFWPETGNLRSLLPGTRSSRAIAHARGRMSDALDIGGQDPAPEGMFCNNKRWEKSKSDQMLKRRPDTTLSALENRCTRERTVGSNPTPSATTSQVDITVFFRFSVVRNSRLFPGVRACVHRPHGPVRQPSPVSGPPIRRISLSAVRVVRFAAPPRRESRPVTRSPSAF